MIFSTVLLLGLNDELDFVVPCNTFSLFLNINAKNQTILLSCVAAMFLKVLGSYSHIKNPE